MPLTLNKTNSSTDHSAPSADGLPRQRSGDLLQGGRRLIIEHRGEDYCLRITRNERLILTKL